MNKKNNNNGNGGCVGVLILFAFFVVIFMVVTGNIYDDDYDPLKTIRILSSYDNQAIENELIDYAEDNDIYLDFTYMGDLDIVDELNMNSSNYDAVWISNSMWLYMLKNSYLTSDSKSISISPVVFGVRKSKAKELGLTNGEVSNKQILELIREKKIKYLMPSVTQTNTGATAYLGFLSALAGNPEVLTEDMLQSERLITDLKGVFSGVERVSGDEKYLENMFISGDSYEAVIASEASLINMNKSLKESGKEELYLIYPTDGVAVNDSTFALITKDKEDMFLTIQNYLLSDDGQKLLEEKGQRTWYGGVSNKADKNVFNPSWGIDTTNYLNVTKYPSKDIITKAINLYIETLRKPTHVVFCLDYSGSMNEDGNRQLVNAMDYILDYEQASKDKLQFSKNDKITVITFSSRVNSIWTTSGHDTTEIRDLIANENVNGTTALYDAIISGIKILDDESTDYTKTIIAMTDGEVNVGTFNDLKWAYETSKAKVPVYSITFGYASEEQLNEIGNLTNSKVFDGKSNLLRAFKEVRSYN